MTCHNLQLHLAYRYIKIYVSIRHTLLKIGEAMYYQTQMPIIFVILFSDIGQCFRLTQSLENQKSGHVL